MGDGLSRGGIGRTPDGEPGIRGIVGDENAIRRVPGNGVPSVLDAEPIGIPDRAQLRLDGELQLELAPAMGRR